MENAHHAARLVQTSELGIPVSASIDCLARTAEVIACSYILGINNLFLSPPSYLADRYPQEVRDEDSSYYIDKI